MKIFLVRHGRYDEETGLLTEEGRDDVVNAAITLGVAGAYGEQGELPDVLCSPRKRAIQAAEILWKSNGFKIVDWLDDGPFCTNAYPELSRLAMREAGPGIVVAVSHMPVIAGLMEMFAKHFDQQLYLVESPGYGSVHVVDTVERQILKLT